MFLFSLNIKDGKVTVWPTIDNSYHVILIHLAWKSIPSLEVDQCYRTGKEDYQMTLNIFKAFASQYQSKSIIFISTSGDIYKKNEPVLCDELSPGIHNSYYSYYKLAVEKYLSKMTINSLSLRVSNAWGCKISKNRRNGFIDRAIYNARYGEDTKVTISKKSIISIIHIEDLCRALYMASEYLFNAHSCRKPRYTRDIYNLSGEFITIQGLIDILKKSINARFIVKTKVGEPSFTMVDSSLIYRDLKWTASHNFNGENVKKSFDKYIIGD